MGFHDVVFLPSRACLHPAFLIIMIEVKALRLPHDLDLWLWVSKGMLPVSRHCFNKSSFNVNQMSLR